MKSVNSASCAAALYVICVLPASAVRLTAHRGASYDAPENTLAAFNLAWEQGADGIEGDFYLTSDGHVVCIHDSTTARTGDINLTVATSTLAELKTVDVGSFKGEEWAGERIPTLQEVIETIPSGKYIQIEVKVGVEIIEPIAQILEASSLADDQIIIICFNQAVVTAAKNRLPECRVLWLASVTDSGPSASEVLGVLQSTGADGVGTSANATLIDADYVSTVQAAGTNEFNVWTVNTSSLAEQFAATGLDAISTDRPAYLRPFVIDTPPGIPVLCWTFDGSATNSTGTGPYYNATLVNGPVYTNGVAGSSALALDGMDDYVSVPYTLPHQGSIALWYYATPWYNYQSIYDNSCSANDWEMWIDVNGILYARVKASNEGRVYFDLDNLSGADHWYHIVYTWDKISGETHLFVNGVDRSSGNMGTAWVEPGSTFYLGGGNSGNTACLGVYDDVRIYDSILDPNDILEIYHEYKNEIVYLPFNGNAVDHAGEVNAVTVSGNPQYVKGVCYRALDGDGSGDNVAIAHTMTEEGSIALWYYAQGPWYNYQTVFDNSVNQDDWEMWIYYNGLLRFRVDAGIGEVSCELNNLDGPDKWYHIAVTWDRYGKAKLYVNGVLRDQDDIGSGWVDPGSTVYLGGHTGNTLGNGIWDEVHIYNRILELPEIEALAVIPPVEGTVFRMQ